MRRVEALTGWGGGPTWFELEHRFTQEALL